MTLLKLSPFFSANSFILSNVVPLILIVLVIVSLDLELLEILNLFIPKTGNNEIIVTMSLILTVLSTSGIIIVKRMK